MNPLKRAVADLWNGPTTKPNPWPKCEFCYRRHDPAGGFCSRHTGVRMCVLCCPYGGSHPRKDEEL